MASHLLTRSAEADTRHPHKDITKRSLNVVSTEARIAAPAIERLDTYRKTFNLRGSGADFGQKQTISLNRDGQNIKARGFRLNVAMTNTAGTVAEGWGVRLIDKVQFTLGGQTLAEFRYLPAWKAVVDRFAAGQRDAERSRAGIANDFTVNGTAYASIPLFFFDKFVQGRFASARDQRSMGIPLALRSAIKLEVWFNTAAFVGDAAFAAGAPNVSELELEYDMLTAAPSVDFVTGWSHAGHYLFTEQYDDSDRFGIAAGVQKTLRITDLDGPVEYMHVDCVTEADLADGANVLPASIELKKFHPKINGNSQFDDYATAQRLHGWQSTISDYYGTAAAPRGYYIPWGRTYCDDIAHVSEHGILLDPSDDITIDVDTTSGAAARAVITTIKQVLYRVTPNNDLEVIFEHRS